VNCKPACVRHGFSWRNLKRHKQFTENKKVSDEHLRDGIIELCGSHGVCVDAAKHVYYPVVRKTDRPVEDHNKWGEKEGREKRNCSVFRGVALIMLMQTPVGRRLYRASIRLMRVVLLMCIYRSKDE
jgi:hypothetical protein